MGDVRAVFLLYLAVIVGGLAVALAVGVLGQ